MFKGKEKVLSPAEAEIERLQKIIIDLETQLNKVANDNGSVVIKMLPNGQVEMNGIEMDNTTEVDYYNSSQATFGELTMFRVGKEAKQREMNKLISSHMDECDRYKTIIDNLNNDVKNYVLTHQTDQDTIETLENEIKHKDLIIDELADELQNTKEDYEATFNALVKRYDGMFKHLEADIQTWKERYLELNNIRLDGTIITQYGEYCGNQETEDCNNE